MNTVITTNSLEEFKKAGLGFLRAIKPQQDKAVLVALVGDLGAGKTTLVQDIARELGVKDEVNSPTFTIAQFYRELNSSDFKEMIHVDAYRLENLGQLEVLGFNDWLKNPETIIFLEWPNQVGLREGVDYWVNIKHGDNPDSRIIDIKTE